MSTPYHGTELRPDAPALSRILVRCFAGMEPTKTGGVIPHPRVMDQ